MSTNEELNKLPQYKDKQCIYCNRAYPATVLNIEGHIHHGVAYVCLNTKPCVKAVKKKPDSDYKKHKRKRVKHL